MRLSGRCWVSLPKMMLWRWLVRMVGITSGAGQWAVGEVPLLFLSGLRSGSSYSGLVICPSLSGRVV
jgi:hypothetical protein